MPVACVITLLLFNVNNGACTLYSCQDKDRLQSKKMKKSNKENSASIFNSPLNITTSKCTLNAFLHLYQEGDIYFDATYQREYVWSQEDVQALLTSLFTGYPIGGFSAVINKEDKNRYYEVIDGKQRLISILKFMTNKVPYRVKGETLYFKDLSQSDQRAFRGINATEIILSNKEAHPVTFMQKVEYFKRINFSGVKQSDSHKTMIFALTED